MLALKKLIKKRLMVVYPVMIVSLLMVIFPTNVFAQEKKEAKKKQQKQGFDFYAKTPLNASLRSVVVPGWGQFFNQQKTKGCIVAGATLLSLTTAVLMSNKANSTYSDYEAKGVANDPLYDDYSTQFNTSVMFGCITAAIWVWGAVDAYLFAPSSSANLEKLGEQGLAFEIKEKQQFVLVYSKRF